MPEVFISYSHKNADFVQRLYDALRASGRSDEDIWVDWEDIPKTADWWDEVKKGIESTDTFMFIITPDSLASSICLLEISHAINYKKRIIPIVHIPVDEKNAFQNLMAAPLDALTIERLQGRNIEEMAYSAWSVLSKHNWLFFRKSDDFNNTFVKLIEVIETDLEHVRHHTRLLMRALEWDNNERHRSYLLTGLEIDIAERWIRQGEEKSPELTDLHRDYVATSRRIDLEIKEEAMQLERRARQFRQASTVFGVLLVLALAATLIAGLSTVNAQAVRATIEFEGTVFGLEQNRAGTLVAGLGLVPVNQAPQSAQAVVGTATTIVQLLAQEARIEEFDGVAMVFVPPGCFFMGSTTERNEQPVHQQCFDSGFWMDRFEVSNRQFERLGGEAEQPGNWQVQDLPRENINWFEAQAFCELRGGRLPTEAQWEYAARGPDSLIYPWGNQFDESLVVYNQNSQKTNEVDSLSQGASWLGIHHMSGNVMEWTNTIFDQELFPYPYEGDDREASAQENDSARVLRGGSLSTNADGLRSSKRERLRPEFRNLAIGFRCVRDA